MPAVVWLVVGVALCSFVGCVQSKSSRAILKGDFINGTKLQLVTKKGPLLIYMDTTSTNKIPDYAIFEGNCLVVIKENSPSNTIQSTYGEEGFSVLDSERDHDGNLLHLNVNYQDRCGQRMCSYSDRNGSGIFDRWYQFNGTNNGLDEVLIMTNFSWVPIYKKGVRLP